MGKNSRRKIEQPRGSSRGRPVVCHETGEVFASMAAAAKAKGTKRSNIRQSVRLACRAAGCHWYLADQPNAEPIRFAENKKKPVVNIETGEVFESQAAAAKSVNRSTSSICDAVKSCRTAGGCHWRRATEEEIAQLKSEK